LPADITLARGGAAFVEEKDAPADVIFAGHDPFLVTLSVAVSIMGGYT
jgi:hypothetical protein